jgi:hypothetical protein
VPIFCLGGAVARVADESTAFLYRDASHDINIVASWLPEEAGDADRNIECVQGSSTRWNPTAGVYVNFTSDDAEDRVRQTYNDNQGAPTYALKAKYDPTNFFRMNPNISAGSR